MLSAHPSTNREGRLLISCPDRPGIVSEVSRFLFEQGANIIHSDQHSTDPAGGFFFMRIQFDLENLEQKLPVLQDQFLKTAETFGMSWSIRSASEKRRLALFATKEDHCLQDLLWRWSIGELPAEISMVVSNHPDLEPVAARFNVPYHHVPVTPGKQEEAEETHLQLLEEKGVDTVILARYMQIIPPRMIRRYPNRIINIHHSFLPAFAGARPYAQAFERGVKIIGATAHYVTEELDQGPIIEQNVERVDHRSQVEDLKRIGRDVERMVLARAVQWHLKDRTIVHGNKTVVFR